MSDDTQIPATQVQIRHHRRTLNIRAQDRIIQADLFSEAWTLATREQRKEVLIHINVIDYSAVKDWVLKIMVETLDRCSMKILRELARHHQIKNYSRLIKAKLLDALSKKGATDDCRHINGSSCKTPIKTEANFNQS